MACFSATPYGFLCQKGDNHAEMLSTDDPVMDGRLGNLFDLAALCRDWCEGLQAMKLLSSSPARNLLGGVIFVLMVGSLAVVGYVSGLARNDRDE